MEAYVVRYFWCNGQYVNGKEVCILYSDNTYETIRITDENRIKDLKNEMRIIRWKKYTKEQVKEFMREH